MVIGSSPQPLMGAAGSLAPPPPPANKKERDYHDVVINLDNCILPSELLDETPTMRDGLDRDIETDLRAFGCELIQTAGILLKLPQTAMATGQVLFHRFYYAKSMVKHEVEVLASAAVFLAAKIEESQRRLRDVMNVIHHIKEKMTQKAHTPIDYYNQSYVEHKNKVIKAERRILKELGFCVHVKHPHKLIICYLQILDLETNKQLARKAWNYMNDSLRTDVFVRHTPEVIACSCIFLAARRVKINLPQRPPWYTLFGAKPENVEEIALSIYRLYSRPTRDIAHLEAVVSKARKRLQEKLEKQKEKPEGSFTPTHQTSQQPGAAGDKATSKPTSTNPSPVEKNAENGAHDKLKDKRDQKDTRPRERGTRDRPDRVERAGDRADRGADRDRSREGRIDRERDRSYNRERDRSRNEERRRGGAAPPAARRPAATSPIRRPAATSPSRRPPPKRSPSFSPPPSQPRKRRPHSLSPTSSSTSSHSPSPERPSKKYALQRAQFEKERMNNGGSEDLRSKISGSAADEPSHGRNRSAGGGKLSSQPDKNRNTARVASRSRSPVRRQRSVSLSPPPARETKVKRKEKYGGESKRPDKIRR